MAYLKYQEYLAIGGVCDETAFNRNVSRASSVIDNYMYNRIQGMKSVPDNVKYCCRDLIEYYSNSSESSRKGVSSISQSAGVVSESVSYETPSSEDTHKAVFEIIFDYLYNVFDDNGTTILYKGADV